MKNLRFLLPMLAFIFAMGVAFTAPDLKGETETQAFDYILVNGSWQAVQEQNCVGTTYTCRVQLGTNGPVYDLYDEMGDPQPKKSSSRNPIILP